MSDQLWKELKQTVSDISLLNSLIDQIKMKENEFLQKKDQNTANDCQSFYMMIDQSYEHSINRVNNALSLLDTVFEQNSHQDKITENILPSNAQIRDMLMNFYHGKPKTIVAPVPNFCGCHSNRIKTPSPNQFICARVDDQFKLMVVFKFQTDTVYAFDPYSDPNDLKELKPDQWAALPTILPDKPIARWEFARNNKVFALLPIKNSNTFHPATVISRPVDHVNSENPTQERGYILDFGEDIGSHLVPEQFVVMPNSNW